MASSFFRFFNIVPMILQLKALSNCHIGLFNKWSHIAFFFNILQPYWTVRVQQFNLIYSFHTLQLYKKNSLCSATCRSPCGVLRAPSHAPVVTVLLSGEAQFLSGQAAGCGNAPGYRSDQVQSPPPSPDTIKKQNKKGLDKWGEFPNRSI